MEEEIELIKTYQYFISYNWHSNRQNGSGCIEMGLTNPITQYSDVKLIINQLESQAKDSYGDSCKCVVMNYILLKEEMRSKNK